MATSFKDTPLHRPQSAASQDTMTMASVVAQHPRVIELLQSRLEEVKDKMVLNADPAQFQILQGRARELQDILKEFARSAEIMRNRF